MFQVKHIHVFYILLAFSVFPFADVFCQDEAPVAEKTIVPINNGEPVSFVIARPADISKSSGNEDWFPAFSLEYLFFRLNAIGNFTVVDPETLSTQIREYYAFNHTPPSRQEYIDAAKEFNASFVLYPEYKIDKKNALQFSMTLQSVNNSDKKVICSYSCDIEKADEGIDSCINQLIVGIGITPENYTAKFLRTKIVGSSKCEKLIGTSLISSRKAQGKNHAKIAEDLKKCASQEQAFLADYLGSLEFAKASGFENAALLMKDLIFNLGPVYPALYPLAAQFFRLADQNENAMQMVKVAEGLNLKTNRLVLEKALVLEALNDWDNAERAYQEVMTIDAGDFHALLFLMRKYNKDKKASDALSLSRIFEAKYPDNGYGFLEKAKSLIIDGQSKAAQTALAKAETLLPDNVEARVLMGDLYMQENDYNSALKHYSKAIGLAPQNVDANIKTANAYTLAGNYREALETLKKIAVKFYDNPLVQKGIGMAEFQVGDTSSAKRDLNRYMQNGEPDLKVLLTLGHIYDGLGQYRKSAEMYEKAIPLDENRSMAQRRLDAENAKAGGSKQVEEEKPVYDGASRAATSKFNTKLVVRILTAAVCVGGIAGGYLMNNKIKDTQTKYDNARNKADIDSYHTDLKNQQTMRLLFYCLGAGAGAGFTVTFFIK